ncbi:MAG TPA: gamma-glutamylcyclotransferase [Desulfobacteraceae bacterium]|nr:gamma-glutamylcyclotransferase [Desulfobacteraceae bacterium]
MDNLFVYGILLSEDIFVAASGCRRTGAPCILKGYRRLRVRGEFFPGILPAPGSSVKGLFYPDIPPTAWTRLDRFEGGMFRRQQVEIELAQGGFDRAFVYVVRPEFNHCLEPLEWDLDEFLFRGHRRVAGLVPRLLTSRKYNPDKR